MEPKGKVKGIEWQRVLRIWTERRGGGGGGGDFERERLD